MIPVLASIEVQMAEVKVPEVGSGALESFSRVVVRRMEVTTTLV